MHTGTVQQQKVEKPSVPSITPSVLVLQMMGKSDSEVRCLLLRKTVKNAFEIFLHILTLIYSPRLEFHLSHEQEYSALEKKTNRNLFSFDFQALSK